MNDQPRLGVAALLLFLAVVGAAAAVRVRYLTVNVAMGSPEEKVAVQDAPPRVDVKFEPLFRSEPNELDLLVYRLNESQRFRATAPFSHGEEKYGTAHVAPGYPWLLSRLAAAIEDQEQLLTVGRWTQCGLGAATAGLYFLFVLGTFRNWLAATLAGILCAVHPFWVFNTGEFSDGVVVSFLLALVLVLGMRGMREGEALVSLLFGLALAGLALVRAALLPFAVVGCIWYAARCRSLPRGWLASLLAVLGFVNGIAPWIVRNFQVFEGELVPIASSTHYHLWIGNNSHATGGPLDIDKLPIAAQRRAELAAVDNQVRRYDLLAREWWQYVEANPGKAVEHRLWAALYFLFGEAWFESPPLLFRADFVSSLPAEYPYLFSGALLAMLVLGFLGWRWTYPWRAECRLATLALLWVPVPYLLSHAEKYSGPRLPLDGILISFAAFAICCMIPKVGEPLRTGPTERV